MASFRFLLGDSGPVDSDSSIASCVDVEGEDGEEEAGSSSDGDLALSSEEDERGRFVPLGDPLPGTDVASSLSEALAKDGDEADDESDISFRGGRLKISRLLWWYSKSGGISHWLAPLKVFQ